jgi:ferredoxin
MCSNHNKGIQVKNACANGCLACGLCAKVCPEGAITMVNNLPVIDHSKCTGCGLCKNKCPAKCIHQGNFKCGAHFE